LARYKPGESGNPNGRPLKSRALTAILQAAGNKTVAKGEKRVARKRLLAELLWQAVTEAKIDLPNGTTMEVGGADWWTNVQFLYRQIDGPPQHNVDLTTQGEKIAIVLSWPEQNDDQ
jgi:hypothetical protein